MEDHAGGGGGGGGAFQRIPAWDGTPSRWRRYKQDVELWLEGEDLDVRFSLAARMVTKLSGTARTQARLIPLEELRPVRGRMATPVLVGEDGTVEAEAVEGRPPDLRAGINILMIELENMPGIRALVQQ